MTILTLNDDQSRALAESSVSVLVVDAQGRTVGQIAPLTMANQTSSVDKQVAEAKLRMAIGDGPGRELSEVIEHLRQIAPP
jgi:hypothetical protein